MKDEVVTLPAEALETIVPESQHIAALIALAAKSDELGRALDKIRRFVLARALPGDFVRFREKDGDEGSIELVGPGAERIAADLGISFEGWEEPRKESWTDDNGPAYAWQYVCVGRLGHRSLRVEGRASTRDRFFGFAHGEFKALSDISEPNIKQAARHNAMKAAVRELLGLRRIPYGAAAGLGLDLSKVKEVEFKKGGSKQGESVAEETVVVLVNDVTVKEREKKDGKGKFSIYTVVAEGKRYETLDEKLAQKAKEFKGRQARLAFVNSDYGPKLKGIEAAPSQEAA